MATKDRDKKLTSINCVTNPQHNTPDKKNRIAITILTQQYTISIPVIPKTKDVRCPDIHIHFMNDKFHLGKNKYSN